MTCCALIVAAGQATRFGGDIPKQFRPLAGRPLLSWTIERFERSESISSTVVVVEEDYRDYTRDKVVAPFEFSKLADIVAGGETRQDSVMNGLRAVSGECELVAIHDGARPLVSPQDIDEVVLTAHREGCAILAEAETDTVKRVEDGFVLATLDRSRLYRAQTPQVFPLELIWEAHEQSIGESLTDDAALIEAMGRKVYVVAATRPNPKVTTMNDLLVAEALLQRNGHV